MRLSRLRLSGRRPWSKRKSASRNLLPRDSAPRLVCVCVRVSLSLCVPRAYTETCFCTILYCIIYHRERYGDTAHTHKRCTHTTLYTQTQITIWRWRGRLRRRRHLPTNEQSRAPSTSKNTGRTPKRYSSGLCLGLGLGLESVRFR
jgi:hypothetical protein